MSPNSLEEKLNLFQGPADMIRRAPALKYQFPMLAEQTSWYDEQQAWKNSATLYNQSYHMTDYYYEGPDVKRLFSDLGINSFENFGKNKAKQFVACNYDGKVIADAIVFAFEDDKYSLVGTPIAPNWVEYHAETSNYDVKVTRDDRSYVNKNPRMTFRYQLNGPATKDIVEKAHGRSITLPKFFNMCELTIAGCTLLALNHTMSGVPGREATGLELIGPAEHGDAVLETLLEAGQEFGLRQGGSRSYMSSAYESGWIPSPTPAIYSGEDLKSYREWLGANSLEAHVSVGGSFASDCIEDYYLTPWDLGYGHLIKFDHDFIGRSALEALADQPHRKKVWLRWSDEDVARILQGSLFSTGKNYKILDIPNMPYHFWQYDTVLHGDEFVGVSTWGGYTANIGGVASLAMIDEEEAIDGAEVKIVWGEPTEGERMFVEPHVQTEVRATISTKPIT